MSGNSEDLFISIVSVLLQFIDLFINIRQGNDIFFHLLLFDEQLPKILAPVLLHQRVYKIKSSCHILKPARV